MLGTLKECIIDVASGAYQTSNAAKLAAGTLDYVSDDGLQPIDVLIKKTDTLFNEGDVISSVATGETVQVEVVDVVEDQTEIPEVVVVPTVEGDGEVEGEEE